MSLPVATTDDSGGEARVLAESLQADRLIDIYVSEMNSKTKPFRVQQVLLEQLSDYFNSALQANNFVESKEGRLNFPEDDLNAWRVLLHWMFTKTVPHWDKDDEIAIDEELQNLLIDCWVLGDKYQICAFQNEVMVELLWYYSWHIGEEETFKRGVELTSSASKLRRLMAEGIVEIMEADHPHSGLDQYDGMRFLEDYIRAKEQFDEDGDNHGFAQVVFGDESEGTLEKGPGGRWKDYLVGDTLPSRAWKWDLDEREWGF
ncbi:hypothetical protein LTR35_005700 [Friedmanniomyces endolithicus]|uniref:BTB domain-containing protein n=1 Tax=Friedmanniomyces endolithicus TaxID=329885 RepID=A0AAN6FLC2_9PEZI|nr:hypothetical protein LTS09_011695 [Friedmanniomyces endolithicus]KAK0284786.1 hypothetical protein LTR35_005700 [Friedmanniomyces endolithicus]KAK0297727.1 hypothetical protein LTS00_003860 [Friedmanniomyces endolithicus]KAK0320528.1 hypothetical protein LTR82_008643 [Friedmanniomyces endolithicus]KAK1009132.1 hypothetical protein LTR54_005933 [Friedmanniomyces endolithicus]